VYHDFSFKVYDLHSGRVSQHFSDRELCTGCTKPKVGIELHDIVKSFHVKRDPFNFLASDLGSNFQKKNDKHEHSRKPSVTCREVSLKVGCEPFGRWRKSRWIDQPSQKGMSYELKYISPSPLPFLFSSPVPSDFILSSVYTIHNVI
jgi:hypothetical protein